MYVSILKCSILAIILFKYSTSNYIQVPREQRWSIGDLLHLIENTIDRKRIYANSSSSLTLTLTLILTLTLKRNYVFGLTKCRHFSIKCNDTVQGGKNNSRRQLPPCPFTSRVYA